MKVKETNKKKKLQITTDHSNDTSFISPSWTERSLLASPNPALYRAAVRSAQGSHYLQNSTCEKRRFTCSVIAFSVFVGDEVANTEQSTVSMCLRWPTWSVQSLEVTRCRRWFINTVLERKKKKTCTGERISGCFLNLNSTTMMFYIQTFKIKIKKKNGQICKND